MSWDSELEAFAKYYATKCIWEHHKERGQQGENFFAMSGNLDVKTAVENWYSEYQYYNMTTSTCEEGQLCGHYTQVVWANSEHVGCGTVFCETLEILNDTDLHLVVCNYEPPHFVLGFPEDERHIAHWLLGLQLWLGRGCTLAPLHRDQKQKCLLMKIQFHKCNTFQKGSMAPLGLHINHQATVKVYTNHEGLSLFYNKLCNFCYCFGHSKARL
ncbi:peptidase inhibitor 16-like isoform X1 [Rhineura floridana]|uniref:peptidase inhibitor 16-like isoform X1 n=1 Tax=Rhineura floridana TaxID=261503 RepID=UPI002AC7EE02|nr:peptidase inhibitor 16-like isoform X1 [Rhineura floridana]